MTRRCDGSQTNEFGFAFLELLHSTVELSAFALLSSPSLFSSDCFSSTTDRRTSVTSRFASSRSFLSEAIWPFSESRSRASSVACMRAFRTENKESKLRVSWIVVGSDVRFFSESARESSRRETSSMWVCRSDSQCVSCLLRVFIIAACSPIVFVCWSNCWRSLGSTPGTA